MPINTSKRSCYDRIYLLPSINIVIEYRVYEHPEYYGLIKKYFVEIAWLKFFIQL